MSRFAAPTSWVIVIGLLLVSGCAAPPGRVPTTASNEAALSPPANAASDKPASTATPVTMPGITYIVPTNSAYVRQLGTVEDLNFASLDAGPQHSRQLLMSTRNGSVLLVAKA